MLRLLDGMVEGDKTYLRRRLAITSPHTYYKVSSVHITLEEIYYNWDEKCNHLM